MPKNDKELCKSFACGNEAAYCEQCAVNPDGEGLLSSQRYLKALVVDKALKDCVNEYLSGDISLKMAMNRILDQLGFDARCS